MSDKQTNPFEEEKSTLTFLSNLIKSNQYTTLISNSDRKSHTKKQIYQNIKNTLQSLQNSLSNLNSSQNEEIHHLLNKVYIIFTHYSQTT